MKEHYKTIPGWFNCPELYLNMVIKADVEHDATFVEIGCWKGKSSAYMAEQISLSGKPIKLYCVDTWKGTITEQHHQVDPDVVNDKLFEVFTNNLSPFAGFYIPIRSLSVEAATQFSDNSLDFVYIDASHEYEDVKADIEAWLPKVKVGGTIAGDDYNMRSVRKAVNKLIKTVSKLNRFTWAHIKTH